MKLKQLLYKKQLNTQIIMKRTTITNLLIVISMFITFNVYAQNQSDEKDLSYLSTVNEIRLPSKIGNIKIEEYFLYGKKSPETNEDGIFVNEHYAAVIDGATSKSNFSKDGKTSGRLAMELVIEAISKLPSSATMEEAIEYITANIYEFYKENDMLDELKIHPNKRFTANGVIYSNSRQEVWQIGDCQCIIGDIYSSNEKAIDGIMANARAAFNEVAILKGEIKLENLGNYDPGREFIKPFLERQAILQNNPNKEQPFSFPVFDGFPIHPEQVNVFSVKNTKEIILSSDGYPYLFDTLKKSEEYLLDILKKDPNCFREYKSTKGMKKGNHSFDDRAYLKISLE